MPTAVGIKKTPNKKLPTVVRIKKTPNKIISTPVRGTLYSAG